MSGATDWIYLSHLTIPCVVGLFDPEQQRPQPLEMEIGAGLDLDRAASGDLAASVDYRGLLEQAQFIALEGRWRLLESMATAIAAHLLAEPAANERRASIDEVIVRLAKPEALQGRAVPRVEIRRERAWQRRQTTSRQLAGCPAQVLLESKGTGVYHLDLPARAWWAIPAALRSFSALLVAGALSDGDGHGWGPGEVIPHGASAVTAGDRPARLLVVSLPPIR